MPATTEQITNLRNEFSSSEEAMPDAWVQEVFAEAEKDYSRYDEAVIVAAANYNAAKRIRNALMTQVTYTQNETREQLSDAFKAAASVAKEYKKELETKISIHQSPASIITKPKKVPSRKKKYP